MVGNMDQMDPLFTLPQAQSLTNIRKYDNPPSSSSFYIDDGLEIFPLEDIKQATNNFAQENIIEKDYEMTVYKGELSGKKLAFILVNEGYCMLIYRVVKLSSLPKHQNVVSFVGFCDEDGKNILVFEHPTRGSLDKYVSSTAHLTWLMRVKICLDIASGLQNLPIYDGDYVRDWNSANIHLDENWQAKIQLISPRSLIYHDGPPRFTDVFNLVQYSNPLEINRTGIYSFGVILFELLCARLEVTYDEEGCEQFLSKLARSHYEAGTLIEIIDPLLRVQMNRDSFTIFSEIAYACLDENEDKRPTISQVVEELEKVLRLQQGFEISELEHVKSIQHMKIPLEEIRSATCDFRDDFTIPRGTSNVYKADLYHFNVNKYAAENKIKRVSMEEILEYPRSTSTVAIKSIDGRYGQRTEELLQTLLYLSHENLVKLVGFCDEDDR